MMIYPRSIRIALLSIVMMAFCTFCAYGQIIRSFGLKLGPTLADQQRESFTESITWAPISPIWGIDAAAFAEFLDIPYVSILSELHYTQKGLALTMNEMVQANNAQGYIDLGPREIQERLHYVSLAVLAKFRFETEVLTPFVALGPSLDYLVGHQSSQLRYRFDRFDVSIAIGAGLEVPVTPSATLMVEFRYTPSVTHAYKDDMLSMRNQIGQFLVGVAF